MLFKNKNLLKNDGGPVLLENNDQAHIKGKGIIGSSNSTKIEDVQYFNRFEVTFKPNICEVKETSSRFFFLLVLERSTSMFFSYMNLLSNHALCLKKKINGFGINELIMLT